MIKRILTKRNMSMQFALWMKKNCGNKALECCFSALELFIELYELNIENYRIVNTLSPNANRVVSETLE